MSPEYLYQLAELADPDELWRKGGLLDRMSMPEKERQQLDTGVALRRYASHLEDVRRALAEQKSVLITPLSASGTAHARIETPPEHQRRRDCRAKALGETPRGGD